MKFPYLIASRYFLFGLIEVRQWGWRAGLTKPQIDLLLIDQPVIDYVKSKKKYGKDDWKTRRAAAWKVNAAVERWQEEHGDAGEAKGVFSLNGFEISGGDAPDTGA